MAITRRNILLNPVDREKFARGVNLLKRDFSAGVTTQTLGFSGTPIPVSVYDQFVTWHYLAMNTLTPDSPTNVTGRNSAHRGPSFLPWHRFMLLLFEQHLRRVLNDTKFGLPYWDWAADGDLPPAQQVTKWHCSEYTSWAFGQRLRAAGLFASMGTVGNSLLAG